VKGHELWLLDTNDLSWKRLALLPPEQQVNLLCWLPGQAELVCAVSARREEEATIWRLSTEGQRANLCQVKGYVTDAVHDEKDKGLYLVRWAEVGKKTRYFVDRLDPTTGAVNTRKVTELAGTHPGPLQKTELLISSLEALDWRAARIRTLASSGEVSLRGKATPDGRWVLAEASLGEYKDKKNSSKAEDQEALVALDLADGRFHKLADEARTICDFDATGRKALVCSSAVYEAIFPDPSKAQLLELYLDWSRIASLPGTPNAEALFSKSPAAGAGAGGADKKSKPNPEARPHSKPASDLEAQASQVHSPATS
ncbi:MAG: hypothetical protein J7M26_08060, partial [Armatimonadetes bacterium]|nr:hypothetical protein [Armatimonadota bacterium]